jgi:hypothetical protein
MLLVEVVEEALVQMLTLPMEVLVVVLGETTLQ